MTGPRLSIIPARAATDPALKPRDLQVLCVLGRHTDELGWCSPSQVKMAKAMGCARSTVFEAMQRLISAGYVERYEQEGANGRDCPHLYRVILDPKHPDPASIEIDDDGPPDPADQSAPPAGISAPPAGPGPAPKNDPSRTVERERAREPEEDPKKIDAAYWGLVKHWPDFKGMPKEPALKIWRAMPADDRAEAARRFPGWLALLKRQKKSHTPAPSSYLTQRLWAEVDEAAEAGKAAVVEASPFSKPWMAKWLAELTNGPTVAVVLTAYDRGVLARGEADERQIRLEKQAQSGFPLVNTMSDRARFGQGATVTAALAELSRGFVVLWPGPDAELIGAWEALCLMRGWPWLPEFRQDKPLFFPAGPPEEALKAFGEALRQTEHEQAAE